MALKKVCLVAAALMAASLVSCGGDNGDQAQGGQLSAARDLIGTWKTALPVTMNVNTDYCGTMTLAVTQPWNITFVITAGQDDNHVNVEMAFTTSNSTIVHGCPDTGVVPEVSPLDFAGVISSSNLVLSTSSGVAGSFHFTTDILTGTFDYTWTAAYTQEEFTATNGLVLLRQ